MRGTPPSARSRGTGGGSPGWRPSVKHRPRWEASMSAALAASGAFGYVILALGVVGILVNLAMAGLALSKRRVPLAALVAAPLLALAVGAFGTWLDAGSVWAAVD